MNKIEHKDGKVFIDGQEYAPVDKPKFPERVKGEYAIGASGAVLPCADKKHRTNYNDWQSREFAEIVSQDQRRCNAMWQAVYMFDPESKGRGLHLIYKHYNEWRTCKFCVMGESDIGVNSKETAQNCIDWLTEQGV